jgi:hypothetical protein
VTILRWKPLRWFRSRSSPPSRATCLQRASRPSGWQSGSRLRRHAGRRAALIATEAVTEHDRHGGGGTLRRARMSCNDALGIEMLAIDAGAGMQDFEHSATDGVSTPRLRRDRASARFAASPTSSTSTLSRTGDDPARGALEPPCRRRQCPVRGWRDRCAQIRRNVLRRRMGVAMH